MAIWMNLSQQNRSKKIPHQNPAIANQCKQIKI